MSTQPKRLVPPPVEASLRGRLPGVSAAQAREIVRLAAALAGRRHAISLGISAVTDAEIRRLNRIYRRQDKVTDVLSFRLADGDRQPDRGAGEEELGDIFICVPQVRRQAKAIGRAASAETALMVAHGTLHLLGYDHATPAQERRMFAVQHELLARMEYI